MFEFWHLQLIAATRRAVLGTIALDGRPHLVPVCFAFEEGSFGIPIDEKPKRRGPVARLRNIDRDPRVTLLIDRYDDAWASLAWIRIDGRAVILPNGAQHPLMLTTLRRRYPKYEAMSLETHPLILITPDRVSSWRW